MTDVNKAALPHLSAPCAVEVKKLEWQEPTKASNGCWTAKCLIGTYSVVNENGWYAVLDEHAWGLAGFEWSSTDLSNDTRQTAFDAAQADFERRILSCVVAKPVDLVAVREECAEVVENAVLSYHVADCAGLADWKAFAKGQESGLKHGAAAIRALSAKPAQGGYTAADELRDLQQSILQSKTLTDFNAVKKTVERLAAPTTEAGK